MEITTTEFCCNKGPTEGGNILRQKYDNRYCRKRPTNWEPKVPELNPNDPKYGKSSENEGGPNKSDKNPDKP